jgi:iron complex outermembrane recepter protein
MRAQGSVQNRIPNSPSFKQGVLTMAYMPKLNRIAGACALLLMINNQVSAEETQLSPVVVTGEKGTGYVAKSAMIAGPGGTQDVDLKDLPASVTVITRDLLDDKQVKVMSEAVRLDASIGDYYSPVGYYENLYIRGFPLDAATSFRVNGLTVTGEQNFAFENKERMEILKGVSALEVGAASPGGIVNFVTKRPKEVTSFTVGTGERGTAYTAVDYGTFFDEAKTLGIRVNAAHEDIRPFVAGAEGKRDFASLAVDAKISNKTKVEFDFEYQNKSERSVPGLMMLGDTNPTFPNVKPDIMLGYYSWVPPTQIISTNASLKINHEIDSTTRSFFNLGHSEVKINDQSLYAYGGGSKTCYNFCADGSYDTYDFRSVGEIHRNDQIQIGLSGKDQILGNQHQWTIGLDELIRSVYKGASVYGSDPTYITNPNNLTPNGFGNLYQAVSTNPTASTYSTGPIYKILDHQQTSVFLNDQIELNKITKLFVGLRSMYMQQTAYQVTDGNQFAQLNKLWNLPQVGVTFEITPKLTTYASYSKGVEPGTIALADSFTNRSVMPPKKTQQIEMGSKYQVDPESLLTIAAFEMKRPNEFSLPSNYFTQSLNWDGLYTLYQQGTVTNRGVEFSLAKKITNRLNLLTSGMYIQAKQSGVQIDPVIDPTQNGAQAIGIPHWRGTAHLDYLIPDYEKLSVQGSWTYSSSKPVDLQDTVRAPGYHRFDAGAKYVERIGKSQATFRLYVENIFNKFYWRDVSQSFGSNFLYPGAPRIMRATATFDF